MFVATEDAQAAARRIARAEGILVGTSSGAAFDAALRLAERIREGVIVTVFPDAGASYLGERYGEEGR
jgi:cysteine synthase B